MSEDRFSSQHDQMEPLEDHEICPVFYGCPDPADLYGAMRDEFDGRDFQVLSEGMKKLAYEDPRAALALRFLKSPLYHFFLKPFGTFSAESIWLARQTRGEGQLSPAEMCLLQRMYTMAHFGCTTTCVWDPYAEEYLMMRSLDWRGAKALCGATRIFHHFAKTNAMAPSYKSVGFLGMVGDLTIMKNGFCCAINYAPWPHVSVQPGTDPTFLLRTLCEEETIQSYGQAKQALIDFRPSAPVFFTLCGSQKGEACVIECGFQKGPHVREIAQGPLVQTNHFAPDPNSPFQKLTERMKPALRPQDQPYIDGTAQSDSPQNWYGSDLMANSGKRQDQVISGLSVPASSTEDLERRLLEIYQAPPVFNFETAYWALLRPKSDRLQVYRRQR